MARGRARKGQPREKMARYVDDLEELSGIVGLLQSQGKVVVFTNGSFDLLHVGHVRCLRDAKSRGDFLVVGINTDASIKQYKDKSLPVQPFEERVEMLGAFGFVDYITKVEDPTVDRALSELRPLVFAKGTDYKPETVPEAETAKKIGAQVVIVGDPKDHSSRDLIARIRSMKTAPTKSAPAKKTTKAAAKTKATKKKTTKKAAAKTPTVTKKKATKKAAAKTTKKKTTKKAAKTTKAKKKTTKKKSVRSTSEASGSSVKKSTRQKPKSTTASKPKTRRKAVASAK